MAASSEEGRIVIDELTGVRIRNEVVDEVGEVGEIEDVDGMFSQHFGRYDHYADLLVTDLEGSVAGVVKHVYAQFNRQTRTQIAEGSVSRFPGYEQSAIDGMVIYLQCEFPHRFLSLISRRENCILDLHRELQEIQQLDLLDQESAASLCSRLIAFLTTMVLGAYSGNGISWSPANYEGDGGATTKRRPDEEYENYIRRRICAHIQGRSLPMAQFMTIPAEQFIYLNDLMTALNPFRSLDKFVAKSHYAPVFRMRSEIPQSAFRTLMAEEFRCVKMNEVVHGNSIFVFSNEQLDAYGQTVLSSVAKDNLRMYVGDYFDELDLSRSFITGSAITAAIIRTQDEDRDQAISKLYSPILTSMSSEAMARFHAGENINLWNIQMISTTEGILTKGPESISFTVRPGSDVDIAIDDTVSDAEYRAIALNHYETIRRYYYYAKMREIPKANGGWNYCIYTDDPHLIPVFRTVELYRTSFRNICTHHVGAVRGCYTSRWSGDGEVLSPPEAKFYLTASAVYTSMSGKTPNYHYFAGRKSNPQDVIVKNTLRGIGVADAALNSIMENYIQEKQITFSPFPFYLGRNVPCSIFAAAVEYPHVRQYLDREREKKERERIKELRVQALRTEQNKREDQARQIREKQRLDEIQRVAQRQREVDLRAQQQARDTPSFQQCLPGITPMSIFTPMTRQCEIVTLQTPGEFPAPTPPTPIPQLHMFNTPTFTPTNVRSHTFAPPTFVPPPFDPPTFAPPTFVPPSFDPPTFFGLTD